MKELDKFNSPELKPDSEKILYFLGLCKEGRTREIKINEIIGMAKYIENKNLIDEYYVDFSRLKIIIHKTLGINIMINKRRVSK